MPAPICDVEQVKKDRIAIGDRGLCRGHILTAPIFGQPGTWQDAACYVGIERLIMESFDDPEWVHSLLGILKSIQTKNISKLWKVPPLTS